MYLKPLKSGLLILNESVDVLSTDDLPTLVDVSCCMQVHVE
jgi:hypothetical protein